MKRAVSAGFGSSIPELSQTHVSEIDKKQRYHWRIQAATGMVYDRMEVYGPTGKGLE